MGGAVVRIFLWTVVLGMALSAFGDGQPKRREEEHEGSRTIAFASVGRAHFAYDLFSVAVPDHWLKDDIVRPYQALHETKLTDGVSVNYNGQFVGTAENAAVLDRLRQGGINVAEDSSFLVFVSERGGSSRVYFNIYDNAEKRTQYGNSSEVKRQTLEKEFHGAVTVDAALPFQGPVLFDRPSVSGGNIVFVSTVEKVHSPGQSWAAVYSADLKVGTITRLTPKGIADFSPSVSPSGEWVVSASNERYQGELQELQTDLYLYRAKDGSDRFLLMKHGGWPSWAGDRTIFFHRLVDDGWWSVFRITLPEDFFSSRDRNAVKAERITPPRMHVVTPAASRTGKWVAVATRRPDSEFRHVEIFDLTTRSFVSLTENISPSSHHYNPFVSPDAGSVGYHRCRGKSGEDSVIPLLQHVQSPFPGLALVRVDGTFPCFSPDGALLAFVRNAGDNSFEMQEEDAGVYVMNVNGTNQRKVFSGSTFALAWDPRRKGVLYASVGPIFQSKKTVQIIALENVDRKGEITWKQLTKSGNNAFPSPSPDGKHLVFRSGRSGYKNLYIMDAVGGEETELRRLTNGPWLDQHPNWSPSGEWIAFVSNRENPNVGSFGKCSIYLIRPDGTGLHKVLESGKAGLTVHPIFSPDGKKLVFVSDLAGVSAEPVSESLQFQPCGEIFMANIDGSNIQRLTHNFVEDGTPSWGPLFLSPTDLTREGQLLKCDFEDTRWPNWESQMRSHYPCFSSYLRQLPPVRC